MTTFIRTLEDEDKELALKDAVASYRSEEKSSRLHFVDTSMFSALPGRPFAYWIPAGVQNAFAEYPRVDAQNCEAQFGGSTKDDFRFLRLWWEVSSSVNEKWFPFAKGGAVSPFYADIYLVVNWKNDAAELEAAILAKYPYLGDSANWVLHKESSYTRPGITWTRRTKSRFSPRVLPAGCIFSEKGLSAFVEGDCPNDIFVLLAILCSSSFRRMIEVQLSAADARAGGAANSYEIGIVNSSPMPQLGQRCRETLAGLAKNGWAIKRAQDRSNETSHAFLLPSHLLNKCLIQPARTLDALQEVEAEIDRIAAEAYGLTATEAADRSVNFRTHSDRVSDDNEEAFEDDEEEEEAGNPVDVSDIAALLSWAVGVSFGRFDWRLATGQRPAPLEPEPFDAVPARSPGMVPQGAAPFHAHAGILVDDPGDPHDLASLVEEVLTRVDVPVPSDLRRWLRKDFFPFHLQRYSKSRRKAPIYWPLSTVSGSYTLWVYYPSLNGETLYTAINDFVEPKLKQVVDDLTALRNKGSNRTRDDEKQFEGLQTLRQELAELRETLQGLAHPYQPHHDDGAQITAAPLWPLFRHKPWQKLLKETLAKLEKGDYDWAHLAMAYRPVQVREKCKTDKSLAIAHGLEHLYIEPEAASKKTRSRKTAAA